MPKTKLHSMRPYLLFVFCIAFFWGIVQEAQGQKNWNSSFYDKYNHQNYTDFKGFHKPINLKKIEFGLLNAAIFFETNAFRATKGLKPLRYQENLEIMAYHHSLEMAKQDFFDHENPKNKDRRNISDRATLAGISNGNISENITALGGQQFSTYLNLAQELVYSWVTSPSHLKAILSTDAVELGCGAIYYDGKWQKFKDVRKQGDGFWIATQNFQLFTSVKAGTSKDKGPKK